MAVDFGVLGLFVGLVGILILLGWFFSRKQVEPVNEPVAPAPVEPVVPNNGIIIVPDEPIYKPEIDDPKEEPKAAPEKTAPKKEKPKPKPKAVPKKYTPRPRKK